jgi:hypothetical protein
MTSIASTNGPEPPDPALSLNPSQVSTGDPHSPCHSLESDKGTVPFQSPVEKILSAEIKVDIEHVPVHDDPRKWSSLKKVS